MDDSQTVKSLLHRVATLAAPNNAKVSVDLEDRGYRVRAAFNMDVMIHGEEGASTKHRSKDSLQHEVRLIISRVMKDLYEHCGQHGIESIQVACEHGVIEKAKRFGRPYFRAV